MSWGHWERSGCDFGGRMLCRPVSRGDMPPALAHAALCLLVCAVPSSAAVPCGRDVVLGPDEACTIEADVPGRVVVNAACALGKWYEVKVSYPASLPAAVDIGVAPAQGAGRPDARSLLNVEKAVFQCSVPEYTLAVALEPEGPPPAGVVAPRRTLVSIRLDELWLGVVPGDGTPLVALLLIAALCATYGLLAPLLLRLVAAPLRGCLTAVPGRPMFLLEYARVGIRTDPKAVVKFYDALGCAEAADGVPRQHVHLNVGGMTQLHFHSLPPEKPAPPAPEGRLSDLPLDEVPAGAAAKKEAGLVTSHRAQYGWFTRENYWRGNIVLGYESLEDLNMAKQSLARLGHETEPGVMEYDARRAVVQDPDGNEIHLVVVAEDVKKYLGNHFGIRPGAPRLGGGYSVGIVNFVVEVPVGTSARIADFYKHVLGCRVKPERRYDNQPVHAKVLGGPGGNSQTLTFVEAPFPKKFNDNYLCLYVENFEKVVETLLALKLCWHDFGWAFHRAGATDLGGCMRDQFVRTREIIDLDTREPLLELHHEIRSTTHPDAFFLTNGWEKPRIKRTNFDPDPRYKHLKKGAHRFGP